jgi:hypothetical protein
VEADIPRDVVDAIAKRHLNQCVMIILNKDKDVDGRLLLVDTGSTLDCRCPHANDDNMTVRSSGSGSGNNSRYFVFHAESTRTPHC